MSWLRSSFNEINDWALSIPQRLKLTFLSIFSSVRSAAPFKFFSKRWGISLHHLHFFLRFWLSVVPKSSFKTASLWSVPRHQHLNMCKKPSIQTWGFLTIFRLGVWLWWDGDISYAFNYDVCTLGLCALGIICKLGGLCNLKTNMVKVDWLYRLKTLNLKKAGSRWMLSAAKHMWWQYVLIEKKLTNKTKHEFIEYDLFWVDFYENRNKSSSPFGGLVVHRQKTPPNLGRMGCACQLLSPKGLELLFIFS